MTRVASGHLGIPKCTSPLPARAAEVAESSVLYSTGVQVRTMGVHKAAYSGARVNVTGSFRVGAGTGRSYEPTGSWLLEFIIVVRRTSYMRDIKLTR